MITYINKENAAKYQALFQKAQTALSTIGVTFDAASENPAEQPISTLEQYFAYLKTLANLTDTNNPNIGRYFTRLPLDEEFFEINANTRKIAIPADFQRNGIAVRGDELAEVVYFTIDRFFDAIDLARSDVNIAIQWTNGTVSGVSRNYGKDIETIPGKIIFGWPISSELTAAAGTIRFSVRFYKIEEASNNNYTFSYSLNTLPADVKVNDTLAAFDSGLDVIDHGNDLIGRIENSVVYDPSIVPPTAPTFVVDLSEEEQANIEFVDLDNNGEFVFAVSAFAPSGILSYNWRKYGLNSDGTPRSEAMNATDVAANINQNDYRAASFEEDEEIDNIEGRTFYYLDPISNTYKVFAFEGAVATGEANKVMVNETEYALLERYSTCKVTSTGAYFANAETRVGTSAASTDSKVVIIPAPKAPVIQDATTSVNVRTFDNDEVIHVRLAVDGSASLPIAAVAPEKTVAGRDAKENDDPQVEIAYQWYTTFNSESSTIDLEDSSMMINENNENTAAGTAGAVTEDSGVFSSALAISSMTASNVDLKYQVKATSTRNGASASAGSPIYRVTSAPQRPATSYNGRYMNYTGAYVNAAAQIAGTDAVVAGTATVSSDADNYVEPRLRNGAYNLNFSITNSIQHDRFTYVWMKANIEDEVESDFWTETMKKKLQVDVGTALEGLFGADPTGDSDIPAEENITTTVRAVLEETGEVVEGQENGPYLQLPATASGIYYCIVVNELNGFIAVNASPFFRVG